MQDGIQFTLARWRAYRGYEDVSSQQSKRSLMSADDDDNDNDDLELNLGKRSAKQQKSRKQQRRKSKPKVVSKNSSSDDASEPAKTGGLVEEAEVEQGLHASQAKIKVTPTWIAKGQGPSLSLSLSLNESAGRASQRPRGRARARVRASGSSPAWLPSVRPRMQRRKIPANLDGREWTVWICHNYLSVVIHWRG